MASTRREFIKNVGIAIASLATARCVCPIGMNLSTKDKCDSPRECLRQCWMRFDWLAQEAQDEEQDIHRLDEASDLRFG